MIIGSALLLIAFIELIIGIRFFIRYQRTSTPIFYGIFCISASFYVGGNAMGYLSLVEGIVAERIAWAGGAAATSFFLPFTYAFPFPQRPVRELFPLAIWPAIVFVSGFLFSDALVKNQLIYHFGKGYATNPGDLFWLFLLFFFFYWAWSLRNLIKAYKRFDGIHRAQIGLVLGGITVSLLATSFFDVIMPLIVVVNLGYIGSLLTSIWVGITAYIVYKQ